MIVQYLPATEFRRPPSQKTSEGYREKQRLKFEEMSRSLLNIAERPLPRLTLRGVGLTSKDAVS